MLILSVEAFTHFNTVDIKLRVCVIHRMYTPDPPHVNGIGDKDNKYKELFTDIYS